MKLFNIMQTTFENYDTTVKQYLSKTFNNLGYQYSHNQIFGVIYDGIKGILQNAMFYIEDALTEQNILTASRKKSIYSLAKISGYDPYYGSAASGSLLGQIIRNSNIEDIDKFYINNYTRIINKNTGINYIILLNTNRYVIYSNQPLMRHEFKILQGNWAQYQYSASGEVLERVSIDANSLFDKDYMHVYVNGEEWSIVSSLYDMSKDSKECILSTGYENIFDIVFGNGIYGKMLNAGDVVQIVYLSHLGSVGNIGFNDSSDFIFVDNGYDSAGDTINLNDYISLSLNSVISGGSNADTISFVRNMIGYNSRSNVLASEDNFKLFFKRFSFIGHVNCWSIENSMTIYATCISNIIENISSTDDYYKITNKINNNEGILLTSDQKLMVINTLKNSNKSFAGLSLKFKDPEIRRYAVFCYIKTKSVYSKEDIFEKVKEELGNYFLNLKDDCKFIPKSDLINLCSNCHSDIESFELDIISELAEDTYYNGYYYIYEQEYIDGTFEFVSKKKYYESEKTPGIDDYGNISLSSNLEIPILGGGFKYYINKNSKHDTSSITIEPVNIVWI